MRVERVISVTQPGGSAQSIERWIHTHLPPQTPNTKSNPPQQLTSSRHPGTAGRRPCTDAPPIVACWGVGVLGCCVGVLGCWGVGVCWGAWSESGNQHAAFTPSLSHNSRTSNPKPIPPTPPPPQKKPNHPTPNPKPHPTTPTPDTPPPEPAARPWHPRASTPP